MLITVTTHLVFTSIRRRIFKVEVIIFIGKLHNNLHYYRAVATAAQLFFFGVSNFSKYFLIVWQIEKESQNSWNKRPKIAITRGAIIFVVRDIDHRILNNFAGNLSLTWNLFINLLINWH